jgi:hypothetical protein
MLSSTCVGLPTMRSWPDDVFGNAMTSRIDVCPDKIATKRSNPARVRVLSITGATEGNASVGWTSTCQRLEEMIELLQSLLRKLKEGESYVQRAYL